MKSAAIHRLEALLSTRKLDVTVPQEHAGMRLSVVPSGYPAVDRVLGGGWPQGEVSEVVGRRSSGRTAVLVSTMIEATRTGAVVALIDSFDRFEPRHAEAAGVVLDRLLWVRGPALALESARPALIEESVRRAIRAFDLVLRAGGFAVVALDLADVPARTLRTLPYATWLRLAHVNEGRAAAGLLIGDEPMGRSARGASLRLTARPRWRGTMSTVGRLFAGLDIHPVNVSRFNGAHAPETADHGVLSRA